MASFIKSLFSYKNKPTTTAATTAIADEDDVEPSTTKTLEKKRSFFASGKSKAAKPSKAVERAKSLAGVPDSEEYPHRVVVMESYTITTYFFKSPTAIQHDLLAESSSNYAESYMELMTVGVNAASKRGTLVANASYGGRGMSRSLVMELAQEPSGLYVNVDDGGYASLSYVVSSMNKSIPIVVTSEQFTSIADMRQAMTTDKEVALGPEPVIDRTNEANWTPEEKAAVAEMLGAYKRKVNQEKSFRSTLEYTWKGLLDKLDKFEKDGETINIKFINPKADAASLDEAKKWMGAHIAAAGAVKMLQAS